MRRLAVMQVFIIRLFASGCKKAKLQKAANIGSFSRLLREQKMKQKSGWLLNGKSTCQKIIERLETSLSADILSVGAGVLT